MSKCSRYDLSLGVYLGIDEGYYPGPNVTIWVQPDRKGELLIVLYAHYQWLRSNEENARIALQIHQERGYGPLSGGWGDPSAPQMLRCYSQVFGVEISGPRRSVEWGEETLRQWLKTATMFEGKKGLVFSRDCGQRFESPDRDKKKPRQTTSLIHEIQFKDHHQPGGGVKRGSHHGPDALRYFFAGWSRCR